MSGGFCHQVVLLLPLNIFCIQSGSVKSSTHKELLTIVDDVKGKIEESAMASHHKVEPIGANTEEVPEEMMAELKKEIARNVEATRLVKEREHEASEARDRAAESHRKMHEMMLKYEDMKRKLEWTRMTLAETHNRIALHNDARQERIRDSVIKLKDRADICTTKLNEKSQRNAATEEESDSNNIEVVEDGGLTDAERALLQLCQQQKKEEESAMKMPIEHQVPDLTSLDKLEEIEPPITTTAKAGEIVKPAKDYAKTVMDIQMKFCNKSSSPKPQEKTEKEQDNKTILDHESKDDGLQDITMDLNETVSKMEAKCAGVREELGQMAMSEQYMRTKQAQLLAKRREKEAMEAVEAAEKKEKEAQEMRKKVQDMMRLLEERKNKLKITEKVLEKKAVVVDKVNKILDSKERRANYVEKHIEEVKAFDIKPKKN